MSLLDGFLSLAGKTNKVQKKDNDDQDEGPSQNLLPELELDMDDEDLRKLTDKWERLWNDSPVKSEWEKMPPELLPLTDPVRARPMVARLAMRFNWWGNSGASVAMTMMMDPTSPAGSFLYIA